MNKEISIPKPLLEALKQDRLVIFIGAGLSISAGLPSWKDLVLRILDNQYIDKSEAYKISLNANIMDELEVLNKLATDSKNISIIYDVITENIKNNIDSNIHKLIGKVSKKIITTNYDKLLEFNNKNIQHVIKYNVQHDVGKFNRGELEEYIYKIHGDIDNINSCMVFSNDYERLYKTDNASKLNLVNILANKVCLFVGFSFKDPYLNLLFENLYEILGANLAFYTLSKENLNEKYAFLEHIYIEDYEQLENILVTLYNLKLDQKNIKAPSTKKHIYMISSEFAPNIIGGLGVHVTELAQALVQNEINLDIILPDFSKYKKIRGVSIHKIPLQLDYSNPVYWIVFADQVIQYIELLDNPPEVIHCHDWITSLIGAKLKSKHGIPYVLHIHLPNISQVCSNIENIGIIAADLVTVNSNFIKKEIYNRSLPIDINKVRVINNGVNTKIFNANMGDISTGEFILFVGRLVHQKGINILLKALWYVVQKFPDIQLKIVGVGELEDRLKEMCKAYLLQNNVSFEGLKTGYELADYYKNAKFLVVPSIYEPFGMVVLEAFACGKAVIASNLMGLKEIIDNDDGVLFEPYDHLDLAQRIMHMLYDENSCIQAGKKGYEKISSGAYEWNAIAMQFIEFYAKLNVNTPIKADAILQIQHHCHVIRQNTEGLDVLPTDKDAFFERLLGWAFK